jgi:hypothetical protein
LQQRDRAFERSENLLDAFFGGTDNPLRHLGALGLFFLWILVASGLYLYIVLDTSIEGVYSSIGWLSRSSGTSAASCAACTAMPPTPSSS